MQRHLLPAAAVLLFGLASSAQDSRGQRLPLALCSHDEWCTQPWTAFRPSDERSSDVGWFCRERSRFCYSERNGARCRCQTGMPPSSDWVAPPAQPVASLTCTFSHASVYPGPGFVPDEYAVEETTFSLRFVVDGERRAYLIGNLDTVPVSTYGSIASFSADFQSESDGVQFVETTPSGALQVTAIDPDMNAAHSRHTVIFGTLAASQYYGRCTVGP